MPYFRCYVCNQPHGREFEAREGECPECGARAPAVVQLTLVHFIHQKKGGPVGGQHGRRWAMACQPDKPNQNFKHAPQPMSPEPSAVTCPACIQTGPFQEAVKAAGLGPHEYGLQIESGCC
jgi:hypothetical protein